MKSRAVENILKRRIYGLGTEYSLCSVSEAGQPLLAEDAIASLFQAATPYQEETDLFLENGGRFRLIVRCRPKYATPECNHPLQVVLYDKAGERYLQKLALDGEEFLKKHGNPGQIVLFKTNLGFYGPGLDVCFHDGKQYEARFIPSIAQWAPTCYENYLVDRKVSFRQIAVNLIPFLTTRQIFTGTGWIQGVDSEIRYNLSQRASQLREEISIVTSQQRGFLTTRDMPYAPRELYRRLQVIASEPNMSEYTSYLKIGTTAIMLQMLEENFIDRNLSLYNPIKAIRQISEDATCTQVIELEDGRKATAIELQQEYLSMAKRYFEVREPDDVAKDILEKWEYVLTSLSIDPMQLDQKIDWVIKKRVIEDYLTEHHLSWNSPEVLRLSLQYHSLNHEEGSYYSLIQQGVCERLLTDEQIERAVSEPPQTTRARIRGQLIQLAKSHQIMAAVNWRHIHVYQPYQKVLDISDPFQSEHAEAEELIRIINR